MPGQPLPENQDPVTFLSYPLALMMILIDQVLSVVEAIFPDIHVTLSSARRLLHRH